MQNGSDIRRRQEAERLIGLARAMLTEPAEQLTIDYLDHALATLQDLRELAVPIMNRSTPPAEDRG